MAERTAAKRPAVGDPGGVPGAETAGGGHGAPDRGPGSGARSGGPGDAGPGAARASVRTGDGGGAEPGPWQPVEALPRPWLFGVGALVLAGCWLGPLPALAHRSFTAHMTMHMGVVAVGSGLVALGLAGGRWDPARHWPVAFSALLASVVELVIVWGWHAPAPHHFARQEPVGLVLEQGSFLLAGLYLWLSAFGGSAERRRERAASGVVGLLLTSMHMTLLGALLSLAQRPLYAHDGLHGGPAAFGLSPLADQQLGGAVMLLVGSASYLLGGLWLAAGLVRRRLAAPEGRRGHGAAGRGPAAGAAPEGADGLPASTGAGRTAGATATDAARRSL